MKTLVITMLHVLFLASAVFASKPIVCSEPCPACHGKKSVSLTPPNLGQFDGEIGVTQGQPFKIHRFDVKYDRCPLCDGSGRHERMTMQRQPPPADSDATTPCSSCFATGATACQKCRKTGYISCTKCKSNRSKQPGWILTEEKTAGRTSRHMKKIVTPCGECKGIGKVECPACEGRDGTICKKCNGVGFVPGKEHK